MICPDCAGSGEFCGRCFGFGEVETGNRVERWVPIPGYVGYDVSDLGRVRSWKNGKWGLRDSPRLLSPAPAPNTGYLRVSLPGGLRLVHHLVLEAFEGPRPEGMEAAHWDGDVTNASLGNLRWATPLENAEDKQRHGTMARGMRHGMYRHGKYVQQTRRNNDEARQESLADHSN